uniref:Uncharacterized protein n=1 Tax=Sphaerodactylus townsendi TaxID=933632 RepID=A0ACB8FTK9_9SAUR
MSQERGNTIYEKNSSGMVEVGLKKSEAESCYINIARTLEFYGVELHSGRDLHNLDLMIGIASGGIAVYRKLICTSFYPCPGERDVLHHIATGSMLVIRTISVQALSAKCSQLPQKAHEETLSVTSLYSLGNS